MSTAKSLIQSNTVRWAIVGFFCTLISSASTPAADYLSQRYPLYTSNVQSVAEGLRGLCGVFGLYIAGQTIAGRVGAGGVYTPEWMPGPNKLEVQIAANSEPTERQAPPTIVDTPINPPTIIVVQNAQEALEDYDPVT